MIDVRMNRFRWLVFLVLSMTGIERTNAETLKGRVVLENGSPAKEARVWVAKLWTHSLDRIETKSDDQGAFSMEVGPGQWLVNSNLGAQGFDTMELWDVKAGKPVKPKELRLSTMGLLRVHLLEAETNKPIVGGRFVTDIGLDPATGQDGRIEIPSLSRRRSHEAFVVAPGRERKRILFEMSEGPITELELRIPRGGKVVGRVLDSDGKPIPGAFVGQNTSGSILSLTGLWNQADREGRFEYDGAALDRTSWLNADAEGYKSEERKDPEFDAKGVSAPIEFRLAHNPAALKTKERKDTKKPADRRHISGVVLDPEKKPVAGALVRWGTNQSSETIETKTDLDGKFQLKFVPPAQVNEISVMPDNPALAPAVMGVGGPGDQEMTVNLEKAHTTSGVVQNDRGEPFVGVMVTPIVGNDHQGLALWNRSAKTDTQGKFRVTGLPTEGVVFIFLRDGVTDLRNHPLKLDQENVVTMAAAGALLGRVVDHEGKPVRNFRLLLNAPREHKPDDVVGGFFAGFCGIGLSYTSDKGYFVVRNLSAGSVVRLTILAPGHGELTIDRVIARPLMSLAPEKSITYRLPPPASLKVQVADDATGSPIAGARVSLIMGEPLLDQAAAVDIRRMSRWENSASLQTDAQGTADFSPASFTEATVLVEADGFAPQALGWRDGSKEIGVKLKKGQQKREGN